METSQLRRISSQIKSRAHQKVAWLYAKFSHGLPEGQTSVSGSVSLSCKIPHPRYSRAFVTFAPTAVPLHSCSWRTRSPPNLQLLIEPIITLLWINEETQVGLEMCTSLISRLYGMTVRSSWAGGLWILTNLLHCSLFVLPLLPQRSRQLFLCFISEKHRTTHFYTKEWHFSEWLLHQDFLLFLL